MRPAIKDPPASFAVQGQSFTPAQLGNLGTGAAPASGTVFLNSFSIDYQPGFAPLARLFIYTTLPSTADAATGTGSLAIGTHTGGGTYTFGAGVSLDANTKYFAVLPSAGNIMDGGGNTYGGGVDIFDIGANGQLDEGFGTFDIGFRAAFSVPNTSLTVQSTAGSTATTINGSNGTDAFNVRATSGPTTLNAGGGNDVIRVGSLAPANRGTVNAMAAALTINGQAGTDQLTVDDSGDTAANTGNLTATTLTGLGMGPAGLTYSTLENLTVNMGSGNDTFNVVGTAVGTTTTLNGGPGNDVFTGNLSGVITNQLAAARALVPTSRLALTAATPAIDALIVNGEAGTDTLVLDDRAGTAATTVTLTDTKVTGFGLGANGVTYDAVESLDLQPGTGGVTYSIVSTLPGATLTLRGTTGDDSQTIVPTQAAIVYDAGAGNDRVIVGNPDPATGAVGIVSIIGGSGHDIITGGTGNDVLFGDSRDGDQPSDGDDLIVGGAGNDTIDAGGGRNVVFGDQGQIDYHHRRVARIETVDASKGGMTSSVRETATTSSSAGRVTIRSRLAMVTTLSSATTVKWNSNAVRSTRSKAPIRNGAVTT